MQEMDGENGYGSNREYSGGNRRGMTKYMTSRRRSRTYRSYRGYHGYGGSGTGGYAARDIVPAQVDKPLKYKGRYL